MMRNDAVQPAEILYIKRLIESKLGAVSGKLIRAEIPAVHAASCLGAAHQLLNHDLVYNIAGSKFH